MSQERPLLAALALLSAAVTAQQVALMQVLGWMHWHHFAYMVVAIALLGFGIAGTVLSLARERLLTQEPTCVRWLFLFTAISIPLGVRLAQLDALGVDLPLVFFDPARNAWRLAALCLLLLPPFFFGGLATGLILAAHARRAGRFYAASLAGAGLGGLLGLALVSNVVPSRVAVATAGIAFSAVVCLLFAAAVPKTSASRSPPAGLLAVRLAASATALSLVVMWVWPGELQSSQFKPLRRTLDLPGARVIADRPSVHGWIQIVDAPALRPSPSLSLDFQGEVPPHPAVFVNGLGYGSLLPAETVNAPHWLEFTTDAAVFAVTTPRRVLLLENGPDGGAALAITRGATRVTIVEPNREIISLLTQTQPPLAPEWRLAPVDLIPASGRGFLGHTRETFDVIRFPPVGTLDGTAGLASTNEQFLLTRESFADAWRRLAPGGVIVVTASMDFPERNSLRLLSTLVETAVAMDIAPRTHLAAVRGWATVTFLLRRAPWSAEDTAALRKFCNERSFDPLILPNLHGEEREFHHRWQNPNYFELVDQIIDGPRDPIYHSHPFLLRPATDDRPYFSQFFRWSTWHRLAATFGSRATPFFELGSLTVALTLILLTLLAVVGIVLPLAQPGWHAPGKAGTLFYFGGLGAGFMFVEMGLMLEAHAWLGSPVLAASLVLTTLLIFSGGGSLWSERAIAGAREQRRALAGIATGILCVATTIWALGPVARTWPLFAQVTLLIGLIAPLGAAMGRAFPLGLRRLESSRPAQLPWAWAINGCVSVATPPAAMLLAMSAGFTSLFLAAATAYGVALLSVARFGARNSGQNGNSH